MYDLDRFLKAQENIYDAALQEIKKGRKTTHWMWFIFPQLAGLGKSNTAAYYAIASEEEALNYLQHKILGKRLLEISAAVHDLSGRSAYQIFGSPDDLKLHASMTLFSVIQQETMYGVFDAVLSKYYNAQKHEATLRLLRRNL